MCNINDEYIVNNLIDISLNKLIYVKFRKKWMESHPNIKNYLENRYNDYRNNYKEVVIRIYKNINTIPTCRVCGKLLNCNVYNLSNPYGTWCSSKCQLKDQQFIKERNNKINWKDIAIKSKKTKLEKYGDENYNNRNKAEKTYLEKYNATCPFLKEGFIEKSKKTKLEKYGDENYCNVEKIKETLESHGWGKNGNNYANKEKRLNTCNKKYGSNSPLTNEKIKEKTLNTLKEKYNNINYRNNEKAKATLMKKYGYENPWQIPEIREKIDREKRLETLRKNKSFNTSKQEQLLYDILIKLYGINDIKREYKTTKYPFCCDFYIISLDLYIELQGYFTHGNHPYNPNNEDDIIYLTIIKEKIEKSKSQLYKNVISIWSIKDPYKREIAKQNNLNYIEIFNLNFNEFSIKSFIDEYFIDKTKNIML